MIELPDSYEFSSVDYSSLEWVEARDTVLARDGRKCRVCQSEKDLNVHHLGYHEGRYNPDNLVTLCRRCHETITDMVNEGKAVMDGLRQKQRELMATAGLNLYKRSVLKNDHYVSFLARENIDDTSWIIEETYKRQVGSRYYMIGFREEIVRMITEYRAKSYNYLRSEGFTDNDIRSYLKLTPAQLAKVKVNAAKALERGGG